MKLPQLNLRTLMRLAAGQFSPAVEQTLRKRIARDPYWQTRWQILQSLADSETFAGRLENPQLNAELVAAYFDDRLGEAETQAFEQACFSDKWLLAEVVTLHAEFSSHSELLSQPQDSSASDLDPLSRDARQRLYALIQNQPTTSGNAASFPATPESDSLPKKTVPVATPPVAPVRATVAGQADSPQSPASEQPPRFKLPPPPQPKSPGVGGEPKPTIRRGAGRRDARSQESEFKTGEQKAGQPRSRRAFPIGAIVLAVAAVALLTALGLWIQAFSSSSTSPEKIAGEDNQLESNTQQIADDHREQDSSQGNPRPTDIAQTPTPQQPQRSDDTSRGESRDVASVAPERSPSDRRNSDVDNVGNRTVDLNAVNQNTAGPNGPDGNPPNDRAIADRNRFNRPETPNGNGDRPTEPDGVARQWLALEWTAASGLFAWQTPKTNETWRGPELWQPLEPDAELMVLPESLAQCSWPNAGDVYAQGNSLFTLNARQIAGQVQGELRLQRGAVAFARLPPQTLIQVRWDEAQVEVVAQSEDAVWEVEWYLDVPRLAVQAGEITVEGIRVAASQFYDLDAVGSGQAKPQVADTRPWWRDSRPEISWSKSNRERLASSTNLVQELATIAESSSRQQQILANHCLSALAPEQHLAAALGHRDPKVREWTAQWLLQMPTNARATQQYWRSLVNERTRPAVLRPMMNMARANRYRLPVSLVEAEPLVELLVHSDLAVRHLAATLLDERFGNTGAYQPDANEAALQVGARAWRESIRQFYLRNRSRQ